MTEAETICEAEAIFVFPDQPWLDSADMGCAVVAVANNKPKSAQRYADYFARRIWRGKTDFSGLVHILVAERSAMTVDPELFRSQGIEPIYCQIVVVKSPNGFRAAYEPLAAAIFVVDTPGVSSANLRQLPFKRVSRPLYPLDPDTPTPEGL